MKIDIVKCHGSGNDFILIDEYTKDYGFTEEERVVIANELCDRSKSIGADGILFVQKSDQADAKMRIFNADGSEPEMCGNGLRCAGKYVINLLNKEKVLIETLKVNLTVEKVEDIHKGVDTYEVSIGPVSFDPASLPLTANEGEALIDSKINELSDELSFTALSIPNPHIITLVNKVEEDSVKEIGTKANELKSVFPSGVNVSFVKSLGDSSIFVQTFERGVGITNACGTAMSASSLVTCLLKINSFNKYITVFNKGGMVQCLINEQEGDYSVKLVGNATFVFESEVTLDFSQPQDFTQQLSKTYNDELHHYENLQAYSKETLAQFN